MATRSLVAIVLAAGQGSRMRSTRPKPLHMLAGRPMARYVLDALSECPVDRTVIVVGQGADMVTKRLQDEVDLQIDFVEQARPRGTADALAVALSVLSDDDLDDDDVVVLPGDMPLLSAATVSLLVATHRAADAACTVLTAPVSAAAASGQSRGGRDRHGRIDRLIAADDATPEELESPDVAPGVFCFRRSVLGPALRRLVPEARSGEFRLSGVVEVLHKAGYPVSAVEADPAEIAEVDNRAHLAEVEATIRRRIVDGWLAEGVTMVDPATAYIDATVWLGRDVSLFPNVLLQGTTSIGEGAEIGPDTRLVDCVIGDGVRIERTVGRDADVGANARVGPFAVLEPGAIVAPGARVEPFTTVKDQP